MSINSWKRNHYQGRIRDAAKDPLSAALHSLRKWKGLTTEALAEHGLFQSGYAIGSETTDASFNVGTAECALCQYSHRLAGYTSCDNCPLAEANGGVDCCESGSPYTIWLDTGDAKPMIKALERTVKWAKKGQQKCS